MGTKYYGDWFGIPMRFDSFEEWAENKTEVWRYQVIGPMLLVAFVISFYFVYFFLPNHGILVSEKDKAYKIEAEKAKKEWREKVQREKAEREKRWEFSKSIIHDGEYNDYSKAN